jgi:hypothetical protein
MNILLQGTPVFFWSKAALASTSSRAMVRNSLHSPKFSSNGVPTVNFQCLWLKIRDDHPFRQQIYDASEQRYLSREHT